MNDMNDGPPTPRRKWLWIVGSVALFIFAVGLRQAVTIAV